MMPSGREVGFFFVGTVIGAWLVVLAFVAALIIL